LRAHEAPVIIRRRVDQVPDDFLPRPLARRRPFRRLTFGEGEQPIGRAIDGLAEVVDERGVERRPHRARS
jgi:hypothetical protein